MKQQPSWKYNKSATSVHLMKNQFNNPKRSTNIIALSLKNIFQACMIIFKSMRSKLPEIVKEKC